MAKITTTIGGRNIEVEVTDKLTYNFIDTEICDIDSVRDEVVEVQDPEITMPPVSVPIPAEVPSTVIASLLPCDKEGLFPCPDVDLISSYQMSLEEIESSNSSNAIIVPIPITMDYSDGATGLLYLRPTFESKCCCDAEDDKDRIELKVGYHFAIPKIHLKLPCPQITFQPQPTVISAPRPGAVSLNVQAIPDPKNCRKLNIIAVLVISIPNIIKTIRWVTYGATSGCLIRKVLVVTVGTLVVINGQFTFQDLEEQYLWDFMPIQEDASCAPPVTTYYGLQFISGIEVEEVVENEYVKLRIIFQRLKFCCGRFIGSEWGDIEYLTIPLTGSAYPPDPSGTPTQTPTQTPTETPSGNPTETPSGNPTETPSGNPTETPSGNPTETPSGNPTINPTESNPTLM